MEIVMGFCYTLEVCLVIWMQHKSICENFDQYAYVTPNLHSFQRTVAHIWCNWDSTYVVLSLNCDFNWNLFMKSNFFVFKN